MIRYMSSPELKASAKARLRAVSSIVTGATAIYYGIAFFMGFFISFLPVDTASAVGLILSFIFNLVSAIISGMLGAGYQYLFLKLYCGQRISSNDVFYAFGHHTGKVLGLSAVMAAISTVPLIPFTYFTGRYAASLKSMDMALAFFFLTPAVIISTLAKIVYSQLYYLMLDFPDYNVRELFRRSRLLMRGHKGRLFYIIVSFLPLELLGIMTCGVGLLWVYPYKQAVITEFYLDLVSKK